MWKWFVHVPQNWGLIYGEEDLLVTHVLVIIPISSSGDKDHTGLFIAQYKSAPKMEQPNKKLFRGYSLF